MILETDASALRPATTPRLDLRCRKAMAAISLGAVWGDPIAHACSLRRRRSGCSRPDPPPSDCQHQWFLPGNFAGEAIPGDVGELGRPASCGLNPRRLQVSSFFSILPLMILVTSNCPSCSSNKGTPSSTPSTSAVGDLVSSSAHVRHPLRGPSLSAGTRASRPED
jgi:hypothetical protein